MNASSISTTAAPEPAAVLAALINHGLAAQLPESLPPPWRAAYNAVCAVPASTFAQRRAAFQQAIATEPTCAQMEHEVEQAAAALAHEPFGQLRTYSAWEALDAEPPAQSAIVQGIFTRPSLNLLVGAPGSKKTWLALHLAVCVAAGQPWLGHNTQAAPSLIVDEEGGLQRTWSRLARVLRGANAPRTTPVHFIPPSFYNFAEKHAPVPLINRARSLEAGIILIDCLNHIMPGTDENNVLSVQPVLANLRQLSQQADAAVVVIHHTNKQGVFRGSSALSSGVDHMLLAQSHLQDDLIHISTLKSRDMPPIAITAQAHFHPQTFSLIPTEQPPPARVGRAARTLLAALAQSGEAGVAQLAVGRTASRTRNLIHQLTSAGYVTRTNPGRRGPPALYALTPLGQSVINHGQN